MPSILDLISQSNRAPVLVLKSVPSFVSAEPAESVDFDAAYNSVKLCLLRMSISQLSLTCKDIIVFFNFKTLDLDIVICKHQI